ncbi:MAG: hypothetical protein RR458_07315, partial [Clostridia bacterium]
MANFQPTKLDPNLINSGQEFTISANAFTLNGINAFIEGILQSNIDAEKALDIAANIDIVAVDGDGNLPIVRTVTKDPTSGRITVTYTNVKGKTGLKGDIGLQGDKGAKGDKGDTGNGILKTEKVSSVGLVDTFKITYTNNSTFTFTVTNGAKGDSGNAATLAVGTVKTIEPNLPAKVINVGTTAEAIFNFEIPQGKAGTGNGNTTVFVNKVETARVDVTSDIQTQINTKANKTTSVAVALISSGWSGGVQNVVVGGVTATNNIEVGLSSKATL